MFFPLSGLGPPYSPPPTIEQIRRHQPWDPENDIPPNTPVKSKYFLIPRVRQTAIEVNFSRNDLEEFMDRCAQCIVTQQHTSMLPSLHFPSRNLTILEVFITTVLAVSIIPMSAALLWLDFFQQDGFAGFVLCFVATSALFSLIKVRTHAHTYAGHTTTD